MSEEELVKLVNTDIEKGLTSEQAKERLMRDGRNELIEEKKVPPIIKFLMQFNNFLVYLLIAAGVISIIFEDYIEAIIIFVIITLNGVLGFVQEYQAEQSLAALKELAGDDTLVMRDGDEKRVDVRELVVGDVLIMWEGETIGADARIIEANRLKVEEGILTGESVPVNKTAKPINDERVVLAEQANMAFMGTTTVKGRGKAIIVHTGMETEMGNIAKATIESEEQKTPLTIQLEKLGKILGILVLAIVGAVFLAEIFVHQMETEEDWIEIIETSIALAVSAVPEGLAAAVTLTLAIGVQRMAKKRAIIRKLPAVETLGSCEIICTDKTGTLTQNKMTLQRLWTPGQDSIIEISGSGYNPKGTFIHIEDGEKIEVEDQPDLLELLKAGLFSSAAKIQYSSKKNAWICEGDPTEGAMVVAAMKTPEKLDWEENHEFIKNGEIFFDSERKRMTMVYKIAPKNEIMAYMKGSPESVLNCCSHVMIGDKVVKLDKKMKEKILETNLTLANKAFRMLGVAERKLPNEMSEYTIETTEKDMTFIGLAGMIDPPREEVADAINRAKHAGIRIIMITGDQKNTALAIAKALDLKPFEDAKYLSYTASELELMDDKEFREVLADLDVCARASPSIKKRIVRTLQEDYNCIVAMTGDGVNDAPALKKADIGIAMGITGTDVSREASDMILTDDNFATIVAAVEEGRAIYDNMKGFIRFMLSSNFDEILVVLFATVFFGWPSPYTALGILWINLMTDGLPALALAVDPADPDVMKRKPRGKGASMMDEILIFSIIAGVISFVATTSLFAFYYTNNPLNFGTPEETLAYARTIALTVSVLFECVQVFVTRTPEGKSVFQHNPISNKFLLVAVGIAFIAQLMIIYIPPAADVFQFAPIGGMEWLWMLIAVFGGMIILDLVRLLQAKYMDKMKGIFKRK